MAWELPHKPIYLDEELHESYEMGRLPLLNRNDKNISNSQYGIPVKSNSTSANIIQSNYYYTNIPKQKFAYDQLHYPTANKIQNYISYADKMMKEFREYTNKIPQYRPLSTENFKDLANM